MTTTTVTVIDRQPSGLPLADFERLHSTDVDHARVAVADAFCAHRLTPSSGRIDARFHSVETSSIGLHYLDYGSEVRIQPEDLGDCYLVQIPLSGTAEIASGSRQVVSSTRSASILQPGDDYDMRWAAGNRQLIVKVALDALHEHLYRNLGVPLGRRRLQFDIEMDLTTPAGRSWRSIVDLLRREFEADRGIPSEPLVMRELERLLLSQLLLAQHHSYSEALTASGCSAPPATVRRAAELIEEHAGEILTVQDLAEAVNVSVRGLHDGFRRTLHTSPMRYLREVRLQRAHVDLSTADPASTTVTDVASRWGFPHLGRFAVIYRKRFGESPSQTLRR